MTAAHSLNDARTRRFDRLSAELMDGITEVVALPLDKHTRAQAILSLVDEIYQTVAWVTGSDPSDDELASFAQVAAQAREHERRMGAPEPGQTAPNTSTLVVPPTSSTGS